ncbi:MAG: ModD protein [Fibrobacter sp.]|nr:ModD protein [Fibrobacter sp.]
MFFVSDQILDSLIQEDFPLGDLTVDTLGIGKQSAVMTCKSRNHGIICCTEEASRIINRLGGQVSFFLPSGTLVEPGTVILETSGSAATLHAAWKMIANLIEYYSGVASRTHQMVKILQEMNSQSVIGATRKIIPGTKTLVCKAVVSGGGTIHRTGLSETFLLFKQHSVFFKDSAAIANALCEARKKAVEKKIIVEINNEEDLSTYLSYPVDGLQFDKFTPSELTRIIANIRTTRPELIMIAAGGITVNNIREYALCGANLIVTSSMYHGPTFDLGISIHP